MLGERSDRTKELDCLTEDSAQAGDGDDAVSLSDTVREERVGERNPEAEIYDLAALSEDVVVGIGAGDDVLVVVECVGVAEGGDVERLGFAPGDVVAVEVACTALVGVNLLELASSSVDAANDGNTF